jgi:hypothetical protein
VFFGVKTPSSSRGASKYQLSSRLHNLVRSGVEITGPQKGLMGNKNSIVKNVLGHLTRFFVIEIASSGCRSQAHLPFLNLGCSNPTLGLSVKMQFTLPKVGDLESSETPKNSEDDLRGQISLHWCVLYINGKVLKCRCPKWPRMGHLDICSSSYGQKKGRESNCQFDSRPLKVRNRPLFDVSLRSATWR